jgi:hypothetical protein
MAGRFIARSAVIGTLSAGIVAATIPVRPVPINVRWKTGTTDGQRLALEQRFHLAAGRPTEGSTRSYVLTDPSTGNIRALIEHAAVDDTANLNRVRFRPPFAYDRTRLALAAGAMLGLAGAALWAFTPAVIRVLGRTVVLPAPVPAVAATAAPFLLIVAAVVLLLSVAAGMPPL